MVDIMESIMGSMERNNWFSSVFGEERCQELYS